MPRGNPDTLDPVRTKDEARKRGRNGGKKSGEVRRERKQWKQILEYLLDMPIQDGAVEDLEKIKALAGTEGKTITAEQVILVQVIQKAMGGDLKAIEYVTNMIDQSPSSKIDLNANVNMSLDVKKINELKKVLDENPKLVDKLFS